MSAEPSPGSLEDILGVWDEQGPFPLRDKGDVALLVDEIERLRAELERVRAERDELRALAVSAMSEIDEEHRPDTLTTTPRGACVICWPKDGSWPCVSNLAMSDLRAWLAAHPVEDR